MPVMMTSASPNQLYWLATDKRVYSGVTEKIVTDTDPAYVAWVGAGHQAIPWPIDLPGNQTNQAMQDVLTPYGMFVDLKYYAADARFRRTIVGIKVTSISNAFFASDTAARNSIDAAYAYMVEAPTATVQWKMMDATFVTLDKAKCTTVMKDMAKFTQDCYACESSTVSAITGGTITTRTQVDSAFAAVSNVFP